MPWVADGITWFEVEVLQHLEEVGSPYGNPELARLIVSQEFRSYLLWLGSESALRAAEYAWLGNGLDAREILAFVGIAGIAEHGHNLAEHVLGYSWLEDGVNSEEASGLYHLSRLAVLNPGLTDRVLKWGWLDDDIIRSEWSALAQLAQISDWSSFDVELAGQELAYKWLADGVTWQEWHILSQLSVIVENDPELARRIIGGEFRPYLLGLGSEPSMRAAEYLWLADGLDAWELQAFIGIAQIANRDLELADRLLGYSWLEDGVSQKESDGIANLAYAANNNLEFTQRVVSMGLMDDPLRDRDLYALDSVARISFRSDDLELLTGQSWFDDGLDDEETAFLAVLETIAYGSDVVYRKLLEARFTQSATISSLLAGDVEVWVFWHNPFPQLDDTTESIEDAVRTLEAIMGVPFPTSDIIVLLKDPGVLSYFGALVEGLLVTTRSDDSGNDVRVIHHETAHYYNVGLSRWFNEGFANFVAAYIADRTGMERFENTFAYLEHEGLPWCITQGIESIQKLLDNDQEPGGCNYILGEHLLYSLFELLGEDAMSAALRELYLQPELEGRDLTEEDFYRAFLKHTPPELGDEFRDLYKRLHGGPYADTDG